MAKRTAEPTIHGILLVDKPAGWTSHDVVAKVRGFAGQRQVGHTGTLDPMATGLLVVCLGKATRLSEYMTGHDKCYEGIIQLGAATTTDDAEGEVTATAPVPALEPGLLQELEASFTGSIEQVPPAYSAVKVAGRRAYAVARKGETVELAARSVTVQSLRLEAIGDDRVAITATCSAGTYVRSLARDIARAAGTAGHLASLRRTRAGVFDVEDAHPLETLSLLTERGLLPEVVISADEGVADLSAAILDDERSTLLAHGSRLWVESKVPGETLRIYSEGGEFLGMGEVGGGKTLRPVKVLTR